MGKREIYKCEIRKSWCRRCGICVAFCPTEILAQDNSGVLYVKAPDRCTGCQLCQLRCLDFAVSPKKEEKSCAGRGEAGECESNEIA